MHARPSRPTRRRFLRTTAALAGAAAVPMIVPRSAFGASERVRVAAIGAGGKGAEDIEKTAKAGGEIAFLCDVDRSRAAGTLEKFPKAKVYQDFRQMLEKEAKNIDAVIVSTPDHVHAVAAVMAMKLGKHVYCQKPLTHSVYEARVMRDVARERKVATQMGNQGHSHPDTRRLVELIRAGVLGKVKEVHVWTDRPIWPQGIDRPTESQTPPKGLDWDLWLGPAPERPYNKAYLPFNWRGWQDFGTGALGDMACHCMDLAFFALELPAPTSVAARSSGLNDETYPNWSVIDYDFPAHGDYGPIRMTWYDGGQKPPAELVKDRKLPTNGIILIGDKDTLFVPSYWGAGSFLSGASMDDHRGVPQFLPASPASSSTSTTTPSGSTPARAARRRWTTSTTPAR